MIPKNTYINLSIYSCAHALVDACSAVLVMFAIGTNGALFSNILLYNLLAFGLQLPFGWLSDFLKKPALIALIGCLLIIISIMSANFSIIAIILAGIGNAMFHIGGGTIALNLCPKKAMMPGIFVAPGGIGLSVGILLARYKIYSPLPFIFLLSIACVAFMVVKSPKIDYVKSKINFHNIVLLIIILLFISIVIRSMVGLAINFSWKSNIVLMILLALSIALGKAFGGLFADKFGWLKTAVISLLIAAPLLLVGSNIPALGLIGIFLFNFTMPITLVAISNLLPGKPGFSFGITTFALITGAFPTFFHYKEIIFQPVIIMLLTILSAFMVFVGLKLYSRKNKVLLSTNK
jgi:hypothetical protein